MATATISLGYFPMVTKDEDPRHFAQLSQQENVHTMPCATAAFFDGLVKMAHPLGLSLSDPAVKKRKAPPLSELYADPTPLPLLHLLDSRHMVIAEVKVTPAAYQADMGINYMKKPGSQGSQGLQDTATTCCIPLLRFTAPPPGWEVLVASGYQLLLHYCDQDLGALRPIFISPGFSDAAGCQG